MKNFKQLPTEGFLCNFSWTLRQVFCSDLAKKNSRTYKILAQNWSDKSRALLKKSKFWNLTIIKSVQFFPLILWCFMFGINILFFWEKWIDSGPILFRCILSLIILTSVGTWQMQLQKCFWSIVHTPGNQFLERGLYVEVRFWLIVV